jgi:beta-glucosidase/6-phospho-beta-glucosidase/beta-galactosidase
MGICFLCYRPTIHRTWLGEGKYDREFADQTLHDLRERDIVVIADLCHFGVPDWVGNFAEPDVPRLFTKFARAFAQRCPWIQLYTPVNEMYVCASFSAALGWWNEQLSRRSGIHHCAEAHGEGERLRDAGYHRRASRCHFRPE